MIKRKLLIEKFEPPTKIDEWGTLSWENNLGQLHRGGNKPAEMYPNGKCFFIKMETLSLLKTEVL